jgi:hypothetical protein
MKLTNSKIIELINRPFNALIIEEMKAHDDLIKLYSTGRSNSVSKITNLGIIGQNTLLNPFLASVVSLYHEDLRPQIIQLFKIQSIEFLSPESGSIYSHFSDIHNTQEGKTINYTFANSAYLPLFYEYLNQCYVPSNTEKTSENEAFNGISNADFYKTIGIRNALYSPNSRYILDFPQNSNGFYNEPYIFTADVNEIHDVVESAAGCEYLILKREVPINGFNDSKKETIYYYYDSARYVILNKDKIVISENEHNLGFCPVIAASGMIRYADSFEFKKSNITDCLHHLFIYNLLANIYDYNKIKTGTPSTISIDNTCKGTNNEKGREYSCANGYINEEYYDQDTNLPVERQVVCQKCENASKKSNLGKNLTIPFSTLFPERGESKTEVFDVLQKSLFPPEYNTEFIKFSNDDIDRLRIQIIGSIIGEGTNINQRADGFNEKQIRLLTDDKEKILSDFALTVESRQKFTDSLLAKARYGEGIFLYCTVHYGRGFFLKDTKELLENIKILSEISGNAYLINNAMDTLHKTMFKDDLAKYFISKYMNIAVPFSDISNSVFLANIETYKSLPNGEVDTIIRLYAGNWIQDFIINYEQVLLDTQFLETTKIKKIYAFLEEKALAMIAKQEAKKLLEIQIVPPTPQITLA